MGKSQGPPVPAPKREGIGLAEMTTEVVSAYLAGNHVAASEVPTIIVAVHHALRRLGRAERAELIAARPTPPIPVRRSVTDDHLISLEDGKSYKSLKRHLSRLGPTPQSYREKWGLPHDYPMVSPAYARARSALAKSMGFGKKRQKG